MDIDTIIEIIRLAEKEYSEICDVRYEETKCKEFQTIKSTIKNFADKLENFFIIADDKLRGKNETFKQTSKS